MQPVQDPALPDFVTRLQRIDTYAEIEEIMKSPDFHMAGAEERTLWRNSCRARWTGGESWRVAIGRIRESMLRYIRSVDRMDQDLVRSAFGPDARNTRGPVSVTVEDLIAGWLPGQAARDISFHMISNQTVEFEGECLAHAETCFVAGIHLKDDPQIEMVGGRYADRFEKRDGEWRIKLRQVLLDWQGLMVATQLKARLATPRCLLAAMKEGWAAGFPCLALAEIALRKPASPRMNSSMIGKGDIPAQD